MRLPKRPVDPTLATTAPMTPTSNRVHPGDLPPIRGTPGKATPRRLPPLLDTPPRNQNKYLEPEPEQEPKHGTALTPGEAARRKKKRLEDGAERDLVYAFELFDRDGSGLIDAGELMYTMILLAKAGRMQEPSDVQVAAMFEQADRDEDGEIDFEEFVQLIENCDLHPSLCSRCQQSQFVMTEDMWFGEPRPKDPTPGWRAHSTFRTRMAAREHTRAFCRCF